MENANVLRTIMSNQGNYDKWSWEWFNYHNGKALFHQMIDHHAARC